MPAEEVATNRYKISGDISLFATIDSCVAVALIGTNKRGLAHVHYDGTREHRFCDPADQLLTAMSKEIQEVRFAAISYLPQITFPNQENRLATCVKEWLQQRNIPLAYTDSIDRYKGEHIAEKQLVVHPDSLYTLYLVRRGIDKRIINALETGEKRFTQLQQDL